MNDKGVAPPAVTADDSAARLQRLQHLSLLWRFVAPYRARMIGAAVALVVAAACFLVIGQGLKRVIDMGFARGDSAALNQALFALLGVIVVMASATYVRFYLVS
jgi:ATP-binding cassette subfamily B protein